MSDDDEEAAYAGAGGSELAQADRMLGEGKDLADVCRELDVAEQTYHRWLSSAG